MKQDNHSNQQQKDTSSDYNNQNSYYHQTSYKTYNSQIIVSFVLGIVSLILLFLFFPAGLVAAIIGLVLNRKSSKQLNFMLRKLGFIFTLLGIIFNGALILACIIFMISLMAIIL